MMCDSDSTIIATAERAEAEGFRYGREENNPNKWLGSWANWRQRRLFDWSYLIASFRRNPDSLLTMDYDFVYLEKRRSEWLLSPCGTKAQTVA